MSSLWTSKAEKSFSVSIPPFFHLNRSNRSFAWRMIFAVSPIWISSLVVFGWDAFRILALSVSFGVFWQWFFARLSGKRFEPKDGNAIWTVLFLGLLVPPDFPWFLMLVGTFCAIGFGRELYGGAGHALFDATQVGRVFLLVFFPYAMLPGEGQTVSRSWITCLFGAQGSGFLGQAGLLPVLLGALIVIATRCVDWRIPLAHGLAVLTGLSLSSVFSSADEFGFFAYYRQGCLLVSTVIFGAFFFMTDPITSPVTRRGRILFAVLCGVIAVGIRPWFSYLEAMTFAVLLANAAVPLIDHYVKPASSFLSAWWRS